MTNQTLAELEQQVLARPWFYEFKLPSGKTTPTYGEGRFNAIHDTRQRMTHCTFAADYPDLRHSRSVSPPAAGPLFDLPYRIAT